MSTTSLVDLTKIYEANSSYIRAVPYKYSSSKASIRNKVFKIETSINAESDLVN